MRVILADDAVVLRQGLARLLADADVEVVAEVGTAEELLARVAADRPDVAVVDIRMPPSFTDEGLRAAHRIRAVQPEVGVLVLSQYVDPAYAMRLVSEDQGGVGYLLKDRVLDVAEFVAALGRWSG
jgi:DNA-binding NarL/FixJ family response regulator